MHIHKLDPLSFDINFKIVICASNDYISSKTKQCKVFKY